MPALSAHLTGLSDKDRIQLETWLAEFDQTWRDGHVDAWAKKLAGHPLRRPALLEMVKIELERQWSKGRRSVLEAYLKSLPELGSAATVPAELIQLEFELRKEHGAPAGVELIDKRFPGRRAELEQLAKRSEADSAARQVARESLGDPNSTVTDDRVVLMPASLPEQFGRYRILRKLGRGGMGSVYLAHDTQLDRRVALKVPHFLPTDDLDILERFHREAKAAATLQHANICPVYDVGAHNGVHFLTMAFIEGKPLAEIIKEAKLLPQRQAAGWVRQLAQALQEAHDMGVIHRDLKPANVMINRRQEPVVMDFGLARRSQAGDIQLTHAGSVLGTPAYMSPEQVKGDLPTMGPGCDIYSLGVILYECVAGRPPFVKPGMGILSQILHDEPDPPSRFRADLDPALERICGKAMAKRIKDRYSSMSALAADLGEYLTPSVVLAPPTLLAPAAKLNSAPAMAAPVEAMPAQAIDSGKPAAFSELDGRIARLAAAIDAEVKADLQKALATLRHAQNVPGTLTTLSRLLEKNTGLLPIIAQAAKFQVRAATLEKQIDELRGKIIPAEIASDLHWIRVRANKARHGDEAVAFNLADGEMALHLVLKAVEWHYCRSEWGPKLATIVQESPPPCAIPVSLPTPPPQRALPPSFVKHETLTHIMAWSRRRWRLLAGIAAGFIFMVLVIALFSSRGPTPEALRKIADVEFARGQAALKANDPAAAVAAFSQVIDLDPDRPEAYHLRGRAYMQLRDFFAAVEDFTRCLHRQPQQPDVFVDRGQARAALHDHAGAIRDFDGALFGDPSRPDALIERAKVLIERGFIANKPGDYGKAINDCDTALKNDPGLALAYAVRGEAYAHRGDFAKAITNCDQALKLDDKLALAYAVRGGAALDKKDLAQALKDCDHALALDPKLVEGYLYRGQVRQVERSLDKALADYDTAVQLDPRDAVALLRRGMLRYTLREDGLAIKDFDRAVSLQQTFALAFNARANAHSFMKQYDAALVDHNQALALNPGRIIFLINRGLTYLRMKDYDKATADMQQIIDTHAIDPTGYYGLGLVYQRQKKLKEAEIQLENAIKQASERVEYRAALGGLLIDMKEPAAAATSFQEGLKRDPGHAGCLGGMGRLLLTQEKHAEALDYLSKAIASDGRDPVFYIHRARAYEALGELTKSLNDANYATKLEREQATPSTELTARDFQSLGKAHAANKNYQDAVKYFSQAITLEPNEPAYYLDRAAVHSKLGDDALASQDRATARKLPRK